ncbi:MAG: flippase-like domain-containing protein [Muribaculum sp.]|nr:flippase-like domain-containing protein [Muribaculum sp.]
MAESDNTNHKKYFSIWKVLLPVAIGIAVVALMFWHDARKEDLGEILHSIQFTPRCILCIILAFMCMLGRDFGLTWRFRALTNHQLKWKSAWEVDMLCEFTSCITPSAVGGSSLGMVFLNSKGIEFGKATTLMMTTLILDESFFVLFCPIMIFLTPGNEIFASGGATFSHGIKLTFWTVYAILFIWTLILYMGVIWRPQWIKSILAKICRIRFLKHFAPKAESLSTNMIATSAELKKKPFRFWLEVFGGTALSWTSRYLVVNALFLGFIPADDPYQWIILARQFVIWVVLMVSPTPGGAGLSEWLFSEYYGDLVVTAGMALILAIFWRIISYYLYLLIGAIIVPGWLKSSVQKIRSQK